VDYESYDDDRPTDRADEVEPGDEAADHGAFASDSIFEAPDLATAFLAALDAVDDRAYVAPLLDPQPEPPQSEPAQPESAAPEAVTLASAPELAAAPAELAAPSAPPAPSDDAVAEAFAREQAALELWGSDEPQASTAEADAAAAETAAAEAAEAAEAAAIEAAIQAEIQAEAAAAAAATSPSQTDLVLETVSNQDSYYDPDTLRLARPLFSPDEPRAFAGPVYVGDAAAADGEDSAHAAAADAEAEPEVLEDHEEFVAFSLGETRCVVPIRNVIEIGRIPDAVGVPNAPAWLHGLGNLRGQVLSLIDLRAFLGIGRVRPATGRMLVLRTDDDEVQAGLLVDHVHQIVSLSASRFHEVPDTLPPHYARHAWGVCDYGNYTMIGLEVDDLLGLDNMAVEGADAL
jgi:chemotaxis signal transduction protein